MPLNNLSTTQLLSNRSLTNQSLETHLAQQIVDRTMAIINTNINVMDNTGRIISSGDPSRIGQLHDGALLAIQHDDTVEVSQSDHDSEHTLKGVKAGINLLLKHQQKIVGVVGITGDPEQIRTYAKLVKMTAEMLIEHSFLVEQLQWDKRHIEEFISLLITNQLDQEQLNLWANRLQLDLSQPRIAMLIELDKDIDANDFSSIKQAVNSLENPTKNNLMAVTSTNQIVVLAPCHIKKGQRVPATESKKIDRLLIQLKRQGIHHLHIALGQFFTNFNHIHLSYQSALQVLASGKNKDPQQAKYLFDEFRLPVLLSPLAQQWQGEQLSQAVASLKQQDKSGQLLKTLHALFEHQGNLKACAESLFIHRNTLRYRLDKIESITHISPHNFTGLVELYISSQLIEVTA
ncbi:CdaR family transcriptional regulator [Vibrio sp. S11_S32]|uniref:sugar diacid recognition domain-containing protein n=1 Tax=Vibrio sp. S11_S32 TaxID=2720225 RepID=UPI0016807864|nr:sugar diacid recognition domain-containing protein [Vibrio sp. S11_S32]MBD1576130.1 CdaR family transcriptional regulator [Vibrio sp. S11_S32]